jgi:hypothetical protein
LQFIATKMSLYLLSHQHLKDLRQTNEKTDWSLVKKLSWVTDLWDRQHHRSLSLLENLELTKSWLKIWVSTDRTIGINNFTSDKGDINIQQRHPTWTSQRYRFHSHLPSQTRIQAHLVCGTLQSLHPDSAKVSSKK